MQLPLPSTMEQTSTAKPHIYVNHTACCVEAYATELAHAVWYLAATSKKTAASRNHISSCIKERLITCASQLAYGRHAA